jgi:phosphoglycolate phosphatase
MEETMKFESLIFDIDGTLWDSRALVAEGYNIQLRAEGLSHLCVTAEDLKKLFGKTMTDIADILLATVPQPERYDLLERCMAQEAKILHDDPCHIGYPGVRETLQELAKTYRLFIVSNSQSGYPQLCIEKMGLQGLIEDHLCFGDTGTPKGETIRRLMIRNGITNAAYVGDTQGDLDASEDAGIPFIFAAYGFGEPDHWAYKIHSFEELLTL